MFETKRFVSMFLCGIFRISNFLGPFKSTYECLGTFRIFSFLDSTLKINNIVVVSCSFSVSPLSPPSPPPRRCRRPATARREASASRDLGELRVHRPSRGFCYTSTRAPGAARRGALESLGYAADCARPSSAHKQMYTSGERQLA